MLRWPRLLATASVPLIMAACERDVEPQPTWKHGDPIPLSSSGHDGAGSGEALYHAQTQPEKP
jgi:hypothetical protein